MKGRHHVIVQNRYIKYEFDIVRNLTIIQGDSATGKTTLVDMIREHTLGGNGSGVQISCDCTCRVLEGDLWRETISLVQNNILFIDEGNIFVESREFAEAVNGSSNYFVIVTRENLEMLPVSVTEVYGIKSSGKYGSLSPVYHEMFRIYPEPPVNNKVIPGMVITEDSNSGYEFFENVSSVSGIPCISAGGKSNIHSLIANNSFKGEIMVIADGAAFASQMNKLHRLIRDMKNIHLFLPESFEWLILRADILRDRDTLKVLDAPEEYIESGDFLSWERFFSSYLVEKTKNTYLAYSKRKLAPVYLQEKIKKSILKKMEGILFPELCEQGKSEVSRR